MLIDLLESSKAIGLCPMGSYLKHNQKRGSDDNNCDWWDNWWCF